MSKERVCTSKFTGGGGTLLWAPAQVSAEGCCSCADYHLCVLVHCACTYVVEDDPTINIHTYVCTYCTECLLCDVLYIPCTYVYTYVLDHV